MRDGDTRTRWQKAGWVTLQVIAVLTALGAIGLALRYLHVRWTWYGGQLSNPVPPSARNFSHLIADHQLDALYNLTPFAAMLLLAMVAWWIGSMKRRIWYWPTPTSQPRYIALSAICGVGILAVLIYLGIEYSFIVKESQGLQANDPHWPNQVGMVVTGLREIRLESFFWWNVATTVVLTITFGLLACYSVPRQSNVCDACDHVLTPGQATCPECGTPQVALQTDALTRGTAQFTSGLVASLHQPDKEPTRRPPSPNSAR